MELVKIATGEPITREDIEDEASVNVACATGTRTTTMAFNFLGYALGIPMFLING